MTPAIPVETLNFDHGLTAHIYHDAFAEMPFVDDDAIRIVILHRHYLDPSGGECGRDPAQVAVWQSDNADEWFTIPLFLYDHSGVIYRASEYNSFRYPWDSGRVGIIALKRAAWGNGNEPDDRLAEFADGVAADYTSWANGECYGYRLSDAAGDEIDSCWGFIGIEPVREEVARAANWHLSWQTLAGKGGAS